MRKAIAESPLLLAVVAGLLALAPASHAGEKAGEHTRARLNESQKGYGEYQQFCASCHEYTAVKVDCFQCHASKPEEERQTGTSRFSASPRRGTRER